MGIHGAHNLNNGSSIQTDRRNTRSARVRTWFSSTGPEIRWPRSTRSHCRAGPTSAWPWRSLGDRKKHRDTATPPPRSECGFGNSNNSDDSSTVQQPLTIISLIHQKAWWDTLVMVTNLATRDTTLWLDFSAWGNDLKSHRMKELGASTPLVEPPFSAISTG